MALATKDINIALETSVQEVKELIQNQGIVSQEILGNIEQNGYAGIVNINNSVITTTATDWSNQEVFRIDGKGKLFECNFCASVTKGSTAFTKNVDYIEVSVVVDGVETKAKAHCEAYSSIISASIVFGDAKNITYTSAYTLPMTDGQTYKNVHKSISFGEIYDNGDNLGSTGERNMIFCPICNFIQFEESVIVRVSSDVTPTDDWTGTATCDIAYMLDDK